MIVGQRFNPYNQFRGDSTFLPSPIMRYKGLTSNAKGVWGALSWFAGSRGECWVSQKQIQKQAGLKTEKTARDCLHELERQGFIGSEPPINKRSKDPKKKNTHYFFLKHKIFFENPKDLRQYWDK